MWFKHHKSTLGKILLLLLMLTALGSGLAVNGCVSTTVARGWSGIAIDKDSLYIGSSEGKLVILNATSGVRVQTISLPVSIPRSVGLSCAASAATVAIYGTPTVAGDMIYVDSYLSSGTKEYGKVYAFTLGKDEPEWTYPSQGNLNGAIIGSAVVSGGRVYAGGSDGKLYSLDAATGQKQWEFLTGDKIWSTPAVAGGTVYVASFDKTIYAIDTATGQERWHFETGGAIASSPLIYNDTVYFGSFDRYLYAVNVTDGSLKWKFQGSNWFWAQVVITNNVVYAPCLDSKVYILDAVNGQEITTAVSLSYRVSSSPVIADNLVIVADEEGVLYALDTQNNQRKWSNDDMQSDQQKVYASLTATGGVVYVHTNKGLIYAFDIQSGAKKWSLPLKS